MNSIKIKITKLANTFKNGFLKTAAGAKNKLYRITKNSIRNRTFLALFLSLILATSLVQPALADIDQNAGGQDTVSSVQEQITQSDTETVNQNQDNQISTGDPSLLTENNQPAVPDTLPIAEDLATNGSNELDNQTGNNTLLSHIPQTNVLSAEDSPTSSEDPAGNPVQSSSTASSSIDIITDNESLIHNEADASSTTGNNQINAPGKVEDSAIDTGDINVYANVLNIVNTNLYDSQITELVQNFDSLSANLFLNDPGATSAELAQDLVTKICTDVECKSLSSFTLTSQNLAAVQNNVSAAGDSGGNSITAGNDVKDSSITTGDVNAVVNILNIVNSNLVNSRWTFASINIFGDWQGDLVLPPELYFTDYMTVGTPENAAQNLSDVQKVILDAQNTNQGAIINDVTTGADTGSNDLTADKTPNGSGGDIHDSEVATGQAAAVSNVENHVNQNIINTRWYLGLINTLGGWAGNIYNLPDQVLMSPTLGGLSFFSTTANYDSEIYRTFAEAIASMDEASGTTSSDTETTVTLENNNTAVIDNTVDVSARTGDNSISGADVKRSKILTGNARALANIINFANTNLFYSDLQVGLVNVFGNWTGNIVFGFPDLKVAQTFQSPAFPKEKNQTINYEVDYGNLQRSSMQGVALDWQYDPEILEILSAGSSASFTRPQPGVAHFELGKILPLSSGKLDLSVKTLKNLAEGDKVTTYARIWGLGPELDLRNNESILESVATTTLAADAGQGGQDNQNQDDNNSGGDSGNGSGGGNGGGGGGYSSANLLRIYKTIVTSGTILPGSIVSFKLIVDNDGINDLFNIVIYDTLRGPNNDVVVTKQISLGKLSAREEAVINYDLQIPASAPNGAYTNSAYAEGLNSSLVPVTTQSASIQSFSVGNGQAQAGNSFSVPDLTANASSTLQSVFSPEATSTPAVLGNITNQTPPPPRGIAKINNSGQNPPSNPPLGLVLGAENAEAFSLPETPLLPTSPSIASSAKNRNLLGWMNLLLVCFLFAFGYALAGLIKRSREEMATPEAKATDRPVFPFLITENGTLSRGPAKISVDAYKKFLYAKTNDIGFVVKKIAVKNTSARLRKRLATDEMDVENL
jgi:hypothetical protein